jgi:hypothetical protein
MNPAVTHTPGQAAAAVEASLGALSRRAVRLGLLVGLRGSGASHALRVLSSAPERSLVRVGESLAAELLPLSPSSRCVAAPAALERALPSTAAVALLDDIELLFLPDLKLRPFELLCQIARARSVIAVWHAPSRDALELLAAERVLTYATDGHPEHLCVPLGDTPAWVLG